ncbi:MAG: DinB family protein [Anaerolineales bacterium]
MLDYQSVRDTRITFQQLTDGLTREDLRRELNEMYDAIGRLIADATDADVTFQPLDPAANDPYAADSADANLAWTLGHVIVHLTASMEESAALSAELARGVAFHGRSRAEVDWQTVHTIDFCRARLAESRRMCLAALDMWPDQPNLTLTYTPWQGAPEINAVGRYISGLLHAYDHLGQIADIMKQAKASSK